MRNWQGPLRLIGLGWYVAACIVLGLVVGIWVDGLFNLAPLFTIIGLLLGLVAMFLGVYRVLASLSDDEKRL